MHALDTAPFALRLATGLLAAGISWLSATDIGLQTLRRLAPRLQPAGSVVFGATLGYALLGISMGALALIHVLNPWTAMAVPVIAVVVRWRRHVSSLGQLRSALPRWRDVYGALAFTEKTLCVSAALAIVVSMVAAALPAVWWDPLAYHLPIVALALRHGTLPFDPGLPQTGFPLLAESAALPAYALAGSAGAAMVTLGAGIVLAMLCGIIANNLVPGSGLVATTLLVTSALWLWLAPSFYVDIPFALFATAAIALPFLWTGADNLAALGWLCGAFAGAAASTKYPGLVVAALALASLLYVRKARATVPFVLGFFTIGLAWYVRSWVLTGDPLYPFLTALLAHHGTGGAAVSGQMVQRFYAAAPRYCGTAVTASDALLLPWRLLTDPGRFCGDPGYALRLASVLFIVAAILVKRARPFITLVLGLTAFWFVSAQQWRFLLTALTLFTAVAATAVYVVRTRIRSALLAIISILALVAVAAEVVPSLIGVASNSVAPGYRYIAGTQSASNYLEHRLETYAAAEWFASHAPDAKIFAADDVRDYYFGTNVGWGNSPYPGGLRLDWTVAPAQRYQPLLQRGYRYLVVNANPAYTHRTDANIDWQALARDEASGALQRRFSQNEVYVYAVRGSR